MSFDFSTREGRRQQGVLIQCAAEEAGISLEALAREVGCSRALIYQYVSGATLAQSDRLQCIAERTGKPLIFFYGGDAHPDGLDDRVAAQQELLQAQLSPPDLGAAVATCERLVALARQAGDVRIEASARVRQVGALLQRGEFSRAADASEQALPFLRRHALAGHVRAVQQSRGHALLALGRVEDAESCFAAVVAEGDWTARWQGTVSLAALAEHQGLYERALTLLDDVAALAECAPDARGAALARLYAAGNLANVHLACGDATTAAREATVARDLAVQCANRDQYTEALLTLGVCARLAGALGESRRTLEGAARWARLSEDAAREAVAMGELAQTLVETGRFEDACAQAKDGLRQAIAAGSRRAELSAQLALAHAYLRGGSAHEARYHAAQAWEISAHLGQPHAQATALVALGEVHAARRDVAEARQAFAPARDLAESIGARVPALEAGLGLARLGEPWDGSLPAEARELGVPALLWQAWLHEGQRLEAAGEPMAAETAYRAGIGVLTTFRAALAEEPEGDCYLEFRPACEPYLALARLLRARGASDEARHMLDEAAWPPLEAREEEAV
jgi:transcriptional regulator with XRE-family HTH domain